MQMSVLQFICHSVCILCSTKASLQRACLNWCLCTLTLLSIYVVPHVILTMLMRLSAIVVVHSSNQKLILMECISFKCRRGEFAPPGLTRFQCEGANSHLPPPGT